MGKTKYGTRYPEELRARAVRMVLDHESEYASRSAAILSICQKVGCSRNSLRIWVKQHETDSRNLEADLTNANSFGNLGQPIENESVVGGFVSVWGAED